MQAKYIVGKVKSPERRNSFVVFTYIGSIHDS